MNNLTLTVASLHSKVEKLILLHKKLKDDNAKLINEKWELLKTIEDYKNSINKLEGKNKIIKLAKTISTADENSSDIKSIINELVREIDKSIALLNR